MVFLLNTDDTKNTNSGCYFKIKIIIIIKYLVFLLNTKDTKNTISGIVFFRIKIKIILRISLVFLLNTKDILDILSTCPFISKSPIVITWAKIIPRYKLNTVGHRLYVLNKA